MHSKIFWSHQFYACAGVKEYELLGSERGVKCLFFASHVSVQAYPALGLMIISDTAKYGSHGSKVTRSDTIKIKIPSEYLRT